MNLLDDVLAWDVRSWSRALENWEKHVDWSRVRSALEVGAGAGGLSLWLAKKGIEVTCTDLEGTEARARPLHERHGVLDRVRYRDRDATNLGIAGEYDVVVFKSILGGIGRHGGKAAQQRAIDSMYEALRPGGVLLFAENLVASPVHSYLRRRFVRWGNSWRYVTIQEMTELLGRFRRADVQTTGVAAALGRSEKQRDYLARLDEIALNRVVPGRWQYIVHGIAYK